MKTHFCHIERGHEGDPMTYYSDTACGLHECEADMSDDKEDVTCKNCLKVLNRKATNAHRRLEKQYPEIF